ncbi:MAG: peptidoglycan-binding protein [Proteobacteria bacterium]|nr:peptidoglycan-binding protein [Pseudomonadota bacterium]
MSRLTRPVGQAVKSHPPDAKYVQLLLNDWRQSRKVEPLLVVDGIVGPLTDAAIRAFQKAVTGIVDGRVDCNGPTIKHLEFLHIAHIDRQAVTLAHYGIVSMTPPPQGPVTLPQQAVRYLAALRAGVG